MVASRSDIKRRRRDSSPLDSNPKRTKVHAQRKFAQGVSSLSNLLNLTPVKEKDKSRNNGLGGNQVNGLKGNENAEGQSDVATVGKRALPARGAKKPSIDDMITFLCYRGTSALPSHLTHLNKAPSPEPASQSRSGSSESRNKSSDKASRERDKGNKKPLKSSASSAHKAVTAAQALKRKYQEQRIKKTSVSTIASKVKSTPLLRTTRSRAGAISNLSTRNIPNRIVEKKSENATPSKKKDSSTKDESAKKSLVKTPVGKSLGSKPSSAASYSGSRGGLRSGGIVSENVLRSSVRKLASNVSITRKKLVVAAPDEDSPQSRKLATSLSDFSSEDDQPLVKKPKPLAQVQKLIKKSIASIGRKMKMEPRRSKRGLSVNPSPSSASSAKRTPGGSSKQQTPSTSTSRLTSPKEEELNVKTSGKKVLSASKELNGIIRRSSSQEGMRNDSASTPKSTPLKMKKGYVMDVVHDSVPDGEVPVEARTRRGSRDLRDIADEKPSTNECTPETAKKQGTSSKKKDASKPTDQVKSLSGVNPTSNIVNTESSSSQKNQAELSLSAVLKSPPDLRIPSSIKRPLTAVGITNPMAIAAAAAVVHKTSTEKVKSKEALQSEDVVKEKKVDVKSQTSHANTKNKSSKDEGKTGAAQSTSKPVSESKAFEKDQKPERTKTLSSPRKKDDTSEEDSKPIVSNLLKDMKKSKVKSESSDSGKDNVLLENPKPTRLSRKSLLRGPLDDEESSSHGKAVTKNAKDNDDSKLSSRARRSNIRSLKKVHSSDDEDSEGHAISQTQQQGNAKASSQTRKKSMTTENRGELDASLKCKKHGTRQGNSQSSDDEVTTGKTNKVTKKASRPEESSEDDESESNSNDDSSARNSKPSTRSAAKNKVTISRSSRSTRSGKKDALDGDNTGIKSKQKQKSDNDITSSENESDSERTVSSKAPKTRCKTARSVQREALSESTDDDSESKSLPQRRRQTRRLATATRSVKSRLRSSSSESTSSQDIDEDEDYNDKVKKRLSADKSSKTSKSKRVPDSHNSKSKLLSDEDSDGNSKKTDEKKKSKSKVADDTHRRSQSPRRSSRRGARTHDKKSDLSEGSSSESPGQNRRVLRERRFFSFAEVDPLSDSLDEDVIAATKASLEMICRQKSPEPASPAEPKKPNQSAAPLSRDSDDDLSKPSETIKGAKKSKTDPVQPRKSLSKKRVKPPSEVQPNLNEELEKTLMSINLSPQMSKVLDKSPDRSDRSVSEGLPGTQSPNVAVSCGLLSSNTVNVVSVCSPPPLPATSKPHKVVSKVLTIAASTSSTSQMTTMFPTGLQSSPAPLLSTVQPASSLPSTLNALAKRNLMQMKGFKQPAVESVTAPQVSITSSASLVHTSMVPTGVVSTNMMSTSMVPTSMVPTSMVPTSMMSTSMLPTSMVPTSMMSTSMVPTSMVPLSMVASSAVSSSTVMSIVSSGQVTAPTLSAPGPLVAPMAMASALPQCPPMSSAIQGSIALPMSTAMSMPISLNNQLGISMQTAGNVNLSVPMSGTMTLPLQVGPLPSGSSGTTPFLLPVQSTLGPMLAPGQAIIKKETGGLGGMPNPVGSASPLMVGMNPLVVNSNRTFFLSTGSTMTMASSQQQMMPGPLMPSLLSLRLPDKPAGQQTIVASSPVYVPLFGNAGIIQHQGQVQPQIQTVAGMSTITAMSTNMQNPMPNIQNTVAPNIQNTVTTNIQHAMAANVQNAVTPNVPNVVATNVQNSTGVSSISSAMALAQNQASVAGTGMKRHLVLATKNGPVSKLILSVGEDGSHVLAAASPNSVTTSEGQTLMSVMQPAQSVKQPFPVMNVAVSQSSQARPPAPKLTQVPSKAVQSLPSSTTVAPVVKQPTNVPVSTPGQIPVSNTLGGARVLPVAVPGLPSSTTVQICKSGMPNATSTVLSSSMVTGPSSSLPTVLTMATKPSTTQSFPVSSTVARTAGAWSSSSASTVSGGMNAHTTLASNTGRSVASAHVKPDTKPSNAIITARSTVSSVVPDSSHPLQVPYPSTSVPSISISAVTKMVANTTAAGVVISPTRSMVTKPMLPVTLTSSPTPSSPMKVSVAGSPVKSISSDLKTLPSVSVTPSPVVTSRIPSAHAALAALKSPSGTPTSSRAVAKTSSSRKSYSTAASYAAVKTTDIVAPVVITGSSVVPSTCTTLSQGSSPSDSHASTSSTARMTSINPPAPGMKASSSPQPNKSATVQPVAGNSEPKRKGSEVELASTHRTLSMLSTAFSGIGKERKRDIAIKKPTAGPEIPASVEKQSDELVTERSGLDSLAEIATTLAERSVDTSAGDKRTPEHSLWANPAQILGRETLRVPGLPITANVGTNLPTKNDLAKMKSGAVLADAVEKRSSSDVEKLPKVKASTSSTEKSSVAGLLTSSKADTPRQKVQKWLDDGSKGDLEHKRNCSLLSNGNSCTCDVMAEDISNLNSLADICVSMERINSPVKETNIVKQGSKLTVEKRKKQDPVEPAKCSPQNSPAKPSPPLDSHQRKVAWQTAFGVKSPSRSSKPGNVAQTKPTGTADEQKKSQEATSESSDRSKKFNSDKFDENIPKDSLGANPEKNRSKKNESDTTASSNEFSQEKKAAQRRSLLGRTADSSQAKLDSSAFSADNESSVYAFEAETDAPPVSQPFRRRSKTLSRSDEEDSVSIGSASNPVAVQVSKDPVFVPIQVEPDGSSAPSSEVTSKKNKIRSCSPQNDNTDVYYIPISEGDEDDARAVAVRLGKEGPNNCVVMSAKLVKKPPTFKHPNDSNEDGFPSKRAKMEASLMSPTAVQSGSSQQLNELEKSSSSAQSRLDAKSNSHGSAVDLKMKQSKKEASRTSALDSSSEDTSSLSHMPSSSKDFRESRSSMSPASSRNRSPMSDKTSPPANNKKKNQGRKRQSSIDSDASEKAQSNRGSKSKSSRMSPSPSLPSTSSTSSGPSRPSQKSNRSYNGPVPGNVSEAPVFHPTEKEFQDPYAYIEKIRPIAEKYGLCRIVAPRAFKPDCNVEDDIRFTADNQYVHKMMDRWGPNAKEMRAIVKYIAQHNIHLKHPPLVGGMELDLPRLYTTVQNFGGLMEVMDKKRWTKVAETMRIPKSAQDRASKLDEVYCKCLLPYETLKTSERDNLFEMVEVEWEMRKERRDKRLAATAIQSEVPGGLEVPGVGGAPETSGAQTTPGGSAASSTTGASVQPIASQDEEDEDEEEDEEDEEDECIVKGRSMPLTTFYRTARNTIHMWFKGSSPSATEVEHEFWRHVRDRNFHICVNSGSVDCSDPPYGFPIKNSPFAKHPWNLKVLSNSSGSILRSLGSVIGVTVPTLHFGMVFTTCCWYRDPHNLPWIEYLHTGAKKIWYGIPEHGGEKFRTAMQDVAPHYVRKKALWLASDTAMIPPNMLTERKVPLCRTVQEPGQFIVVFPQAHTSSVATGYIVSESVSFAPPSWIPTAVGSFKEMQNCNEPPLFSLDKLVFSIVEDQRTSHNVLNLVLPAVMEILDREISGLRELKKMGVSTERIERSRKKSSGKKAKPHKEAEEMEVMECDVCSTNLYLSMLVNTEDDVGYCVPHGILYLEQKKMSPSQCKFLHMYNQNELHGFCQTLLDRIEAKSGKKGSNFSSNNSDSGSSASTSTRN